MAKRIVILGAGESGAGAAVLAKKQGFDTFVSDMSMIKSKYKDMLNERGIAWEEGNLFGCQLYSGAIERFFALSFCCFCFLSFVSQAFFEVLLSFSCSCLKAFRGSTKSPFDRVAKRLLPYLFLFQKDSEQMRRLHTQSVC